MMKHLFLTLLLSVILPTVATAKSVVIYDSRTATTESVANEIAKDLNCDIFEIEPALPYDEDDNVESNKLYLTANGQTMTATLVENSSTAALKALLADAPLTISMRDYGNMEKVGSLGHTLPDNDEYITTQAGDLILYQSSSFVIYYAPNSYSFTRLGKIDGNPTRDYLLSVLGNGNVNVTLSLSDAGLTDIDSIGSENKNLKVHVSGLTVEIADKKAGSMVNIYNLNGQTVYHGNSHHIELAEAGIYMVSCDDAKAKVLIY